MVGLNFSRKIEKGVFVNFHDKSPHAQDYKIRYAFKNTEYYGAYMTDIIKNFEQKLSGNVMAYLKGNKIIERNNIEIIREEIYDLHANNPLIIAFGYDAYKILFRNLSREYNVIKIPHYSNHISKENYKEEVHRILHV
jgi:hypothetical protein